LRIAVSAATSATARSEFGKISGIGDPLSTIAYFRPLSLQQRHLFAALLANSGRWMLASRIVGQPHACASLPTFGTVRLPILAAPGGT
jgi:hypothetical protein